jgi:predicted adenine nucleotide alpha hydrolase (AANH) superfamily ATPase
MKLIPYIVLIHLLKNAFFLCKYLHKFQEENKEYCKRIGVEFIDCDYDVKNWYSRMKGMEYDPERGHRCTECFDMRMERAALYAHEHGFHAIATTNSTSRWKDMKQVDESGFRAAARYDGVKYWSYNWQSDEMTLRKYQVNIFCYTVYLCFLHQVLPTLQIFIIIILFIHFFVFV